MGSKDLLMSAGPVRSMGRRMPIDVNDTLSFMNTLVIDDNNKIEQ
jgi:hypothetical protein